MIGTRVPYHYNSSWEVALSGRSGQEQSALQTESQADPGAARCAWTDECRVREWKLAVHRRERTREEGARFREARSTELGRRGVCLVEQIVDLSNQLETARQRVAGTEVEHGISVGRSVTEVIRAVGLVQIVLIAACVDAAAGDQVDVQCESACDLHVGKCLEQVARDHRHPIARSDLDRAFQPGLAFL